MQNYQLLKELASLLIKDNDGHGECDLSYNGDVLQFGTLYGKFEDGTWNVWGAGIGIESFANPKGAAKRMHEATR